MQSSLKLAKYSLGVGDRFAQAATAQLQACALAAGRGVEIIPVWNKSNREHLIIGSEPASVHAAAAAAVQKLGWRNPWHVDADHIRLETVDRFIPHADFFTIDVADSIGKPAASDAVRTFADRHPELTGGVEIPGVQPTVTISRDDVACVARKYLFAVQEAGMIYRHIAKAKGQGSFITEVSLDETDSPQTPTELLIILAALADEQLPLQTIAPKFTGRFNKGVDYVGNVPQFEREFNDDLCVIAFAIKQYGLPENLKLSVHSGSDKFSIYGPIHQAIKRHHAGLHVKTAGTTWLEEIIGLAAAGLMLALETVGLGDRAEHMPNQLSGGQQQRVAIARALANQPSLLLADEPTGNLDTQTSVEIMGVFQKLNDQGITIVMVTHELDIAQYTKRTVVMRDGKVVSDTPVATRLNAEVELQRLRQAQQAVQLVEG